MSLRLVVENLRVRYGVVRLNIDFSLFGFLFGGEVKCCIRFGYCSVVCRVVFELNRI